MPIRLRYGCNPHQQPAEFDAGDNGAVRVRSGRPSLINMLDGLNAWQLVRELAEALQLPAAASFKHVSPAGAAVAVPLPADLQQLYEIADHQLTPLAIAYARARGADAKSSFGDFVALSEPVDAATASYLKGVVSDGVIAPGFDEDALATLAAKKNGSFVVLEANPDYSPPPMESREVFGVQLTQRRNDRRVVLDDFKRPVCGELTMHAKRDLLLATVTAKYTQSNSVVYALDGQTIGIGAGQQSRVDCTKLAGAKSYTWFLQRHPHVLDIQFRRGVPRQQRVSWRVRYVEGHLTARDLRDFNEAMDFPYSLMSDRERQEWVDRLSGVSLASDGFIPFRDNVDEAKWHGVDFIAQPGGSARDEEVTAACREHGIAMVHTGLRLFHH